MNDAPVIEINGLTKRYPGSTVDALHKISLRVNSRQIFGFLGPNGAGKTTTINMMMGLLAPTSGSIQMFGQDNAKFGLSIRMNVGYLTGDMALDKGLTGWQQLEYIGNLRDKFDPSYVAELAKRLDADLGVKLKKLSRGNKQKIGLIAALQHRPKLLIFDEPTSGLDPLIQIEFNKLMFEHKKAGGSVFISSHSLSEVQELCDQIAVIRKGRLVANKPLADVVAEAPKHVRFTTTTKNPGHLIKGLRGASDLKINDAVQFNFKGNMDQLVKALSKMPLLSLSITDTNLEEIFRKYYEDKHA